MIELRRCTLPLIAPLVAIAVVLGPAGRASESENNDGLHWCRIDVSTVNIRVSPNTTNQPVSTFRSGDYFRAKSVENNWLEIEWPSKVPAWVLKDAIRVTSVDGKNGAVRANKARIMSQGMSTSQELALLERGTRVSIVAEKGDWFQVQAPPEARAYICAKYVVVDAGPPAEVVALPRPTRAVSAGAFKPAVKAAEVVDVRPLGTWLVGAVIVPSITKELSKIVAAAAKFKPEVQSVPTLVMDEADLDPVTLVDEKEETPASVPVPPLAVASTPQVVVPQAVAAVEVPVRTVIGPTVVEVDDSNFLTEVETFNGTVLVDFSATWCGPCRRTAPILDSLAAEFQGRVKVAKIDIDRAPGLASRFGVSAIPCLIMFNAGKSQGRQIGAQSRDTLWGWMQSQK